MRFLLVLIVLAVLVALVVKTILVNRRAAELERASPCEDLGSDLRPAAHSARSGRGEVTWWTDGDDFL
jgi:hypothetical protein